MEVNMFCGRNLGSLATVPTMSQIAHQQVQATGEKGCRKEQNKSAKTLCSPARQFSIRRALSNETPAEHIYVKF
jgi:hypothetical protein